MGASNQKDDSSSDGDKNKYIQKNIVRIKPVEVNEDYFAKPDKINEDNHKQILKNTIGRQDYFDTSNPNYHEYMFYPIKNKNLEVMREREKEIEKIKKKYYQDKSANNNYYTYNKEESVDNQKLRNILHLQYDPNNPNQIKSIKRLRGENPSNKEFLVVEYELCKNEGDDEEESDEDESKNSKKYKQTVRRINVGDNLIKDYEVQKRVVHTNCKNCNLKEEVKPKLNGERYDYLQENEEIEGIRKDEFKRGRIKTQDKNEINNEELYKKREKFEEMENEKFRKRRTQFECHKVL